MSTTHADAAIRLGQEGCAATGSGGTHGIEGEDMMFEHVKLLIDIVAILGIGILIGVGIGVYKILGVVNKNLKDLETRDWE